MRMTDRPEVEAFVAGFSLAKHAVDRTLHAKTEPIDEVRELARVLYPPYPDAPVANINTFGTRK